MSYRLDVDVSDGERRAWVVGEVEGRLHVLFGLRIGADRSRWYMSRGWQRGTEAPDPEVAVWAHDHAADFDAAGFDLRRWWHLWQCWDCMAPPLLPCRHHRTGEPISGCHRGRRPRGVRP